MFEGGGPLLMSLPVSDVVLVWVGMGFMIILSVWLGLARFQEKVIVKGYIDMKPGLLHVFPKTSGLITTCHVAVGQHVHKGDVLYTIQTGFDRTQARQQMQIETLKRLRLQLQRDVQHQQKQIKHYQPLLKKHYLSYLEYEQHKHALHLVKEAYAQADRHLLQAQLDQAYAITAPISGVVSQIDGQVGQRVESHHALIKIRPTQAHWVAYLYVPVHAIRFVKALKQVVLRYDAYPFRHYGHALGHILKTTRVISDATVTGPLRMNQAFYRVEVELLQPHLSWKKKILPLYQGMTLDALLLGERRPLWALLQ